MSSTACCWRPIAAVVYFAVIPFLNPAAQMPLPPVKESCRSVREEGGAVSDFGARRLCHDQRSEPFSPGKKDPAGETAGESHPEDPTSFSTEP